MLRVQKPSEEILERSTVGRIGRDRRFLLDVAFGPIRKWVYTLPKHLEQKVVRLHFDKIGVKLTKLNDKQAKYIGVFREGPYKPDRYRY